MDLQQYIDENGLSQQGFAKKIGVSQKTLWNILAGKNLTMKTIRLIEKGTEGMVKYDDLLKKRPAL